MLNARRRFQGSNARREIPIQSFELTDSANGLTMRENLVGGRVNSEIRGSCDRVDKIIEDVLEDDSLIEELILMGMEYTVGEGGKYLSGGQAMKVSIARAIVKNPNILLLDEATASLDERSQAGIVHFIEDEFRNRTVLSVSHRLSAIRNYHRILVFDRGRILQEGTYDELVSQGGLFRTLFMQQEGTIEASPEMTITDKKVEYRELTGDLSKRSSELQRTIALSPIFSSLRIENISLLERLVKVVKCAKDTVLFNRGDIEDEFFIILDGEVEFFVEHGTNEASQIEIVDTYGPGQSFGELALFGDVPRTLGARAKTDLRLCTLNREDLIKLIEVVPQISIALLEMLSKRIAQFRDQIY